MARRTFDAGRLQIKIGDTLRIERPGPPGSMDVPLCPAATLAEAPPNAEIKYLPLRTTFRITSARMRESTPWFGVTTGDGQTGWINSVALLPNRVEKVEGNGKPPPPPPSGKMART